MRVAVVGAGIVGLSAAYFLSNRGHSVTVFERFGLLHSRGSSHGRSRIVRRAYPDAFHTGLMSEAYPLWHDLEAATGRKLLHECGLAYFGDRDAPRVVGVIEALEEHRVPMEVLAPAPTKDRLGIRLDAHQVAVFTPEAGWVAADLAMQSLVDLGRAQGVHFREHTFADPAELEGDFDAVILAAGPWISKFVPLPVRVSLQSFVDVPQPLGGPVWIDDSQLTYGFPADALGMKIGAHVPGDTFDPDQVDRSINQAHLDQIQATVNRHFVPTPVRPEMAQTCLYTNTEDEFFRVGRFGPNGFYASACSGHGFKLGPWTGRLLADLAEGRKDLDDYPRFRA